MEANFPLAMAAVTRTPVLPEATSEGALSAHFPRLGVGPFTAARNMTLSPLATSLNCRKVAM